MLAASARAEPAALDVVVEVAAGTTLAIAGPSGAGKSTLLRIIAGLHRPTRGTVTCDGETWLDTAARTDVAPERRRTGMVFQDYALFPHMSARDNVAYGSTRTRADDLLARLGLTSRAHAKPRALSGGERQRVALARALARDPRCLLLDEPLSALDATTRAHAGRELRSILRDTGVPALLVTHDFTEAALLADRIAVLDGGRIVQEGTAAELAAAPRSSFVADFTGAVVLRGRATRTQDGLLDVALHDSGTIAARGDTDGEVAVTLFPWEVALEAAGAPAHGSTRNRLPARVVSVTDIGGRVRVGLDAGQPLVAEITAPAARELGLAPGTAVTATFKAAATRVLGTAPTAGSP